MAPDKVVDDGWRIPDELWERIAPLLPPERTHPRGGRPWTPARRVLDALFYVLRTGIQWKALPHSVAAGSPVHDRFQHWVEAGVFRRLWRAGLLAYDERVGIDWEWQAMDGAMTEAPLGGGGHRAQPDRPGHARDQALALDRRARCARWPERRRRQPQRLHADRGDAAGDRGRAA